MEALQANSKTVKSFDGTTDCPKRRACKACKYCYVESARDRDFNAKKIAETCDYSGQILRMTARTIDKLTRAGGLRFFSFGDYMPEHDPIILEGLNDCLTMGIQAKVITKQVSFIDRFHDHPAIAVIQISVDNVGDGVEWGIAREYRSKYSKVIVRSAIMHDADISALDWCDIFTLNHAPLGKLGYKKYSKVEVARLQATGATKGKVCCGNGSCVDCPTLCGLHTLKG